MERAADAIGKLDRLVNMTVTSRYDMSESNQQHVRSNRSAQTRMLKHTRLQSTPFSDALKNELTFKPEFFYDDLRCLSTWFDLT